MCIWPVTPIGTGRRFLSSRYTCVFVIGFPIVGLPALPLHSAIVAQTVTSVGPYAFKNRLLAAQRLIISALHASPALTIVFIEGRAASGSDDNMVGGNVTIVMRSSLS